MLPWNAAIAYVSFIYAVNHRGVEIRNPRRSLDLDAAGREPTTNEWVHVRASRLD